jgi:hypothetical protein
VIASSLYLPCALISNGKGEQQWKFKAKDIVDHQILLCGDVRSHSHSTAGGGGGCSKGLEARSN